MKKAIYILSLLLITAAALGQEKKDSLKKEIIDQPWRYEESFGDSVLKKYDWKSYTPYLELIPELNNTFVWQVGTADGKIITLIRIDEKGRIFYHPGLFRKCLKKEQKDGMCPLHQ